MFSRSTKIVLAAALLGCAPRLAAVADEPVRNLLVYHNPEEFAGWPANEGLWCWGDEVLVGFNHGRYEDRGKKHSVTGEIGVTFARSLDGGLTWKREDHAEVRTPKAVGRPDKLPPFPAEVDFTHPDFAMKIRGRIAYLSTNRGHGWGGPYRLPDTGHDIDARTSYIVTGPKSALFFFPAALKNEKGEWSRSFVAETTDGGQTLQFLSWIGDDLAQTHPDELAQKDSALFSTMPAAIRLPDGRLVCSIRNRVNRKKWSEIHESRDGGKSWVKLCDLEQGSTNPAALVSLGGEKIVAVYGNRRKIPTGIAARESSDGGRTWSPEVALRQDGRTWDLGYTRAMLRPDGKVLSVYYYTTGERPEQHIEATLWKPSLSVP